MNEHVTAVGLIESHLDAFTTSAARRLGDVAGVAVTMVSTHGEPRTVGASNTLVRQTDEVQFRFGRGPCLDALAGGGAHHVVDLVADLRWPDYGRAAAELGVRCCSSVPVVHEGAVVAVVKAYAAEVGGLSTAQRALVVELADELASSVALARTLTAYAHEVDDRTDAMNTRRTIDLALGVIMERARCGPDEAYALLRRQSQHGNVRLFDAARQVVAAFDPAPELVAPFERR